MDLHFSSYRTTRLEQSSFLPVLFLLAGTKCFPVLTIITEHIKIFLNSATRSVFAAKNSPKFVYARGYVGDPVGRDYDASHPLTRGIQTDRGAAGHPSPFSSPIDASVREYAFYVF